MNINTVFIFALAALRKAKDAIEAIINLPKPLIPKGTLGVGGTVETLPTASSENEGFYYVVITDGTYAGQAFVAGDTTFSNGTEWVRVPSGDEASVIDDSVTSTALTWSSDKLSGLFDGVKIKSFTYTGNGESTNTITLPTKPQAILSIYGAGSGAAFMKSMPFMPNESYGVGYVIGTSPITSNVYGFEVSCTNNVVTIIGSQATRAFNAQGESYTVYYI